MRTLSLPAVLLISVSLLGLSCADENPSDESIFAPGGSDSDETAVATATAAATVTPTATATAGPDSTPGVETPTPTTPTSGEANGCPLADQDFCAFAVAVSDAITQGDEEAITLRSAEQTIDCGQVDLAIFNECSAPADQLMGIITVSSLAEPHVNGLGEYNTHVGAIIDAIAPGAADGQGEGGLRLVGVGARGTTYDLVATAILDSPDLNLGTNPTRWVFVIQIGKPFGAEYFITSFGADSFNNFRDNGFPEPFTDVTIGLEPWGG